MRSTVKHYLMLGGVFVLVVWGFGGCTNENNPVGEGIPEGNLFPFAQGRIWVSNAYELDTTGVKVQGSDHREVLYASGTAMVGGKQAYVMIDSIYSFTGELNVVDTTYMTVENDNLLLYFGSWITLFKKSEGVNKEYVGGSIVNTDFGFPITAEVKCKIYPKETVATPKATVQAYKLEVKVSASIFGITIEELQYIWFAEGLGPVKAQFPPSYDPEQGRKLRGSESLLVSTNF